MKYAAKLVLICAAGLLAIGALKAHLNPQESANTRQILFIGNSFTSYNDMPALVEKMAQKADKDVRVTMIAKGGYTLRDQAEDNDVRALIDSRQWDDVILQEQSQGFAFRQDQVETDSFQFGEALAKRIRARSPKVRLYWYQTWGYKNGDQDNCPDLPELCTREGMEREIFANVEKIAQRTQAKVVPIGMIWRQYQQQNPQVELYDADEKHPSAEGSQLVAQAFYTALFQ
jgi:hypothetical protein